MFPLPVTRFFVCLFVNCFRWSVVLWSSVTTTSDIIFVYVLVGGNGGGASVKQ